MSVLLRSETGHYRIGISSPVADKAQLRIGSQEAELALRYGEAEQQEIVYFEAVETRALLHEIPEAHRQRLLDKLAACRSGKARETLTCFFECSLSIASAAKKLGIHRNTLIYRLEQIKALTGYDPQHFHDALVLQLALWLEPTERGSG